MVKVSIIVPVYNVEMYLRECLDSCIGQTLKDIEIIAINDGSPDNSIDILREYEKKDSRVIIIDKKNEGVGKARNDGIKKATGEFIAFMDSDDFYPSSDVLEKLYNSAKENSVKVAGGKKVFLLPDGRKEQQSVEFEEYGLKFGKIGKNKYSDFQYDYGYWQYIYDRKMLIENNIFFPPYKRFQDPPFFVKAMIAAGEYFMNDFDSYSYRYAETTPKYTLSKTLDFIHGINDNMNVARENQLYKLYYLSVCRFYNEGSYMAIRNIGDVKFGDVLNEYIKVTADIDRELLKNNGFESDNKLPELFTYLVDTSVKYEKLRNNKALKLANKFIKR